MSIDWIVKIIQQNWQMFLTKDCLDYLLYFSYCYNYWDINQDVHRIC